MYNPYTAPLGDSSMQGPMGKKILSAEKNADSFDKCQVV